MVGRKGKLEQVRVIREVMRKGDLRDSGLFVLPHAFYVT